MGALYNVLEERVNFVKNELKSDIIRLDEKMDIKITALSEKVDYMNKTNERLFDIIIHPSETKKIAG